MSGKNKRSRLYFGMRNYKFETHDENGNIKWDISEEDWKEYIKKEFEDICDPVPYELSYIFHGKDIESDGERKALHVHFVARFENAVYYDSTIGKFGCEKRNFEKGRSETSALLYLTHTTNEAIKTKKRRYNVSELNVLIFDENGQRKKLVGEDLENWYCIKISGKTGSNVVSTDDDVARIIDELSDGLLTLDNVKEELKQIFDSTTATMTWMKNKRYFKEAVSEYQQKKYYDWLENGRSFQLVYIQGRSSIGKTFFAREIAKEFNKIKGLRAAAIHNAPNDTKGARYDFLNGYENEAVTVFDDLRPNTFGYTEFLNLFERERVSKYSSRFNDKAWFAELAFITKSTPIEEWTLKLAYSEIRTLIGSERENALYQPRRRFSLIIDIRDDKVVLNKYILTNKKTMVHELKEVKMMKCPKMINGFWDKNFQKKVIKEIMIELGFIEPSLNR